MDEEERTMTGRVVHFEIPVNDIERGRRFFAEAFGWTIDFVPTMDYALVGTTPLDEKGAPIEAGSINGGMYARSPEAPSSAPVITIDVQSIDQTLATIQALGGRQIAPRTPVGELGFIAYFEDTEGNVLGLWENAQAPDA
jgi:hypothetical protein